MSYTLRFPFRVSPGRKLIGLENAIVQELGTLTWKLEAKEPYYILSISGFRSDAACRQFKDELWAGFMWAQLKKGVAFNAEHTFEKIVFHDDPEEAARNLANSFRTPYDGPIDGLANGNFPVTYPADKRLRFITGGAPTLTLSLRHIFCLVYQGYAKVRLPLQEYSHGCISCMDCNLNVLQRIL